MAITDPIQTSTTETLYIHLSDRCNYRCDHCITSSSPSANRFLLSDAEIETLCAFVNERTEITRVHFTGGEPTLQIARIQKIQASITRPVQYELTTNGWFGQSPGKVLDQIRLDAIIVSHDRYHDPFNREGALKNLLADCVRRGIDTTLKVTLDYYRDLADASELLVPGAKLRINTLEYAGRLAESEASRPHPNVDAAVWNETCPAVAVADRPELYLYLPKKGLTPCCSSLAFDSLARDDVAFSPVSNAYPKDNLLRHWVGQTFGRRASEARLDVSLAQVNTVCGACSFLYADLAYAALPSRYALAMAAQREKLQLPVGSRLRPEDEQSFAAGFRVAYQFVGTVQAPTSPAELPETIRLETIAAADPALLALSRVLLEQTDGGLEAAEIERSITELDAYYRRCTHLIRYLKDGVSVGLIALIESLDHPQLKQNVAHLGFIGIDRTRVDGTERRAIRHAMRRKLREICGERPVAGKIEVSNQASMRNAIAMGRKPVMLCLETRKLAAPEPAYG